jgi:Ran GTPase-activating protein (RanGAP) involved in mRNA processing and transport
MEAMKNITKLCLSGNPIWSEGATIMADALGNNAMPSLKRLNLGMRHIYNDGVVVLVSALEQNTSFQILNLAGNHFGDRCSMALAESLHNIKGLQKVFIAAYARGSEILESTLPLVLEGFRRNTSLVKVAINGYEPEK